MLTPSAGTLAANIDHVSSNQNGSHGVYVGNGTIATIRDSTFHLNGSVGVWVQQTTGTTEATLDNCMMTGNSFGLYAGPGGSVSRISNVTITNNANGLYIYGGTALSFGNNRIAGNVQYNGPPSANIGQQ